MYNGISLLNAHFLEKEGELLRQLAIHSAAAQNEHADQAKLERSTPCDPATDAFFAEVASLYAYVILNYLALLKILKKHDKHSAPIRKLVLEHIFQQAFYLSLEHSYLFSESKRLLFHYRSSRSGQQFMQQRSALLWSQQQPMPRCEGGTDEVPPTILEVSDTPAQAELCFLVDFEIGEVDFSSLR